MIALRSSLKFVAFGRLEAHAEKNATASPGVNRGRPRRDFFFFFATRII
jgi:hypothetical protein